MRKLGTWISKNLWKVMLPLMVGNGVLFGAKLFWHLTVGEAATLGGLAALLTGELPYGGRRTVGIATGTAAYVGGSVLLAFGVFLLLCSAWVAR